MIDRNIRRKKKTILKICYALILTLSLGMFPYNNVYGKPGDAENPPDSSESKNNTDNTDNTVNSYYKLLKEYEEKRYQAAPEGTELVLGPDAIVESDKGDIPLQSNVGGKKESALYWDENYDWFTWSFDMREEGLYQIEMEYYALPDTGSAIQRALMLDGAVPFDEANNITFYRAWKDEGEPKVNNIGDEVWPRQIEDTAWRSVAFDDNQGYYSEPFQFYFTPGRHTLTLSYVDQDAAFGNITVKAAEELNFEQAALLRDRLALINRIREKQQARAQKGYPKAAQSVRFQAETSAFLKSDPTIRRQSNGDPMTEPRSLANRKLNVMGDNRWKAGDQYIAWKFTVPEDGLYKIDMRLAQWYNDGLPVYRKIAIDGKVPFREMSEYRFAYDKDWRMETLRDENGEPYLFYLTEGEHELTMSVVLGPYTEIVQNIMDDTLRISDMYRKIIKITGETPDPNFEYELDRTIPGIMEDVKTLSDNMQGNVDDLAAISSRKTSMGSNFSTIKNQLDKMHENPDNIPRGLTDLVNAQNNLGNWLISLKNEPLMIDYFIINPPDKTEKTGRSNFFQKFATSWYNFISSFTKDYDSVGSVYAEDAGRDAVTLEVWVSRGKEWAEIMKELADEDFTPKTGINVNMNVLPSGQANAGQVNALMLSITSGKAPDVALGLSADSPAEFAFRDAVLDLTRFPDFEEISKRFYPSILTPLKYKKGVFALPETMDFLVMFYRTDILGDIGAIIPDTWNELYERVLPKLYQNGMDFCYGGGFAPLLFQMGGDYYRDGGTKSALDSPEAYKAFKAWTDMYVSYGIPVEANFYNRMRTGDAPIGIANYGHYVQLTTAAPELFGRWDIAPIPGTVKEDGTIDRSNANLLAQTCVIMSQTEHPEESWEFLKWWTGAELQTQFGRELEALLGVEARWNSANIEAFSSIAWDREHLKIIMDAQAQAKELPIVLGGYFTGRHTNNAFNRVVVSATAITRDSLEQAVKDINKELKSKQEEYGYRPEETENSQCNRI